MTYAEVMKTVFKFSDEEIARSIKRQFIEKKINWRLGKLSQDGYYDNPELDTLVNKIKNITPNDSLTPQEVDVFKTLQFENIKPDLENKIQEELNELFKKPEVSPTKSEIKSMRRMLTDNLQKTQKDLL
jgi:hypothetical protein